MRKTRVMAFGTFDCLHPGHRHFLQQAKSYGHELIVVVARDVTVAAVKGHQPRQPEVERLRQVKMLPWVDQACLGEAGDKYLVIRRFQPDVICLGYDQHAFTQGLAAAFPNLKILRLTAYQPERYKSSLQNAVPMLSAPTKSHA